MHCADQVASQIIIYLLSEEKGGVWEEEKEER
jgi:hypothetical protein